MLTLRLPDSGTLSPPPPPLSLTSLAPLLTVPTPVPPPLPTLSGPPVSCTLRWPARPAGTRGGRCTGAAEQR